MVVKETKKKGEEIGKRGAGGTGAGGRWFICILTPKIAKLRASHNGVGIYRIRCFRCQIYAYPSPPLFGGKPLWENLGGRRLGSRTPATPVLWNSFRVRNSFPLTFSLYPTLSRSNSSTPSSSSCKSNFQDAFTWWHVFQQVFLCHSNTLSRSHASFQQTLIPAVQLPARHIEFQYAFQDSDRTSINFQKEDLEDVWILPERGQLLWKPEGKAWRLPYLIDRINFRHRSIQYPSRILHCYKWLVFAPDFLA